MRCLQKCLLLSLTLLCASCSNRQFENRLTETEQNTAIVQHDVQGLEQRVQSMENRLAALSTEVTSLEVKTLKGRKTNYMVVPAVKAGSVSAPASVTASPQGLSPAEAKPTTSMATQVVRPPAAPASAGQKPAMVSPPVHSSPALSLPPTTAPVLSGNGGATGNYAGAASLATSAPAPAQMSATGGTAPVVPVSLDSSSVAAPGSAPTTPIPVQAAVSLALPPENGATGQRMPAPASSPTASVATASPVASAAPVQMAPLAPRQKGEEAAYTAALALARAGQSTEAINRFKAFLQEYPSGRYAPNAYYWIGECMYAQRQYADALLQFKDVVARYPRHHKSADALLKAGMTYTRMGDKENASLQYKAVVTDFPASEAARYVKGRGLAR